MKAYHIRVYGGYCEYSKIVFAETVGKAKAYAAGSDGFEVFGFTEIRATRAPELDPFYRGNVEMDWYNSSDRMVMVKLAGFRCSDECDCEGKDCPAHDFCGRAQEEEENAEQAD